MRRLGQRAKQASLLIAPLSTQIKNRFLSTLAKVLVDDTQTLLAANQKDLANAKEHGISDIMMDRLRLTSERIKAIAQGVQQVADLADPIGQVIKGYTNLDGLKILQKRVPLGVIAMIFESRPNVSVDAQADLDMATKIVINAKTKRPSVCNAAEGLVIHEAVAARFIPMLEKAINQVQPVEWRADDKALPLFEQAVPAKAEDFETEFLDYIMSVKVVSSLEEAISWINQHTSHHSEAIITRDIKAAETFQDLVDAAAVYVNASTRFTDGFVFGLGAEIGISTQKMHARGPMGLEALTSTKFYINGDGHIRE